ncbi:protein FAM187B [Pantherophis guttatus]|uniref:Protein FAM187B n=1 Tax=Pantherophis guttatus TaxID=94885 RepID=A0A6P9CHY1_PANGU|nr:protein FAM187B [Pantherophis guttatus]
MSCWAPLLALFLGLFLTINEGSHYEGHSLGQPCLPGQPCVLAFISNNPIILRCPRSSSRGYITWQYLDPFWSDEQPLTFLRSGGTSWPLVTYDKLQRLSFKSRLIAGNLYIPSPSLEDSGLYTCRAGDATLGYYEVDFQDAERLHVSHAGLGEATLGNSTVQLDNGAQATLFTSWSPWQSCDRCGHPGERKQVGFCYAQLTTMDSEEEMPLPCGMARRKYLMLPQRGPELRIETCQVPCDTSYFACQEEPHWVPFLVFTNYHPQQKSTAHLRCPASSIYSPVYWQVGLTTLTHLQLLQKDVNFSTSSQSLDKATGGGILHLSFQNDSHSTFYQCFVNGHLAGKFLVTSPGTVRPPGELAHTYSIIEALVVGLSIFLVFLMFLSIIESCRRKPETTVV